jgi:hypothetical protein
MRRTATAALGIALLASSARADVIPSRRPDADAPAARRAVATRLQEFGLSARDAASRASDLLAEEARYFAASPGRLQVAGRDEDEPGVPHGEKIFFGALGLLASAGVGAYALWGHKR